MSFCVVAVVATLRRPSELARLLASLHQIESVIVCNNGSDPEVHAVCEKAALSTTCLDSPKNLGCGGGLRLAEEEAWRRFGDRMTHLLVLDDDAALEPDTVPRLVEILDRECAAVVYPLVTNSDGLIGWTPGLKDRARHRVGAQMMPLDEYRVRLGTSVEEFNWAQGICLLARREAVEEAGFHRGDFWVRGEDLDFSLRLTARRRGIFATGIVVKHLPPELQSASMNQAEYLRSVALIQNIAYLGFRQAHGRRIAFTILGAARHLVREWGLGSVADLCRAFWRGAVRGEAAGQGSGATFRQRFDELTRR